MKNNLIYILLGGGLIYFLYDKYKKSNEDTQPIILPPIVTPPIVTPPKKIDLIEQIQTVVIPKETYYPNQIIKPKIPYKDIGIYDITLKKILGLSNQAKFIKSIGAIKNVLKVEAIVLVGNYKVPTKIVGYTLAKYWN